MQVFKKLAVVALASTQLLFIQHPAVATSLAIASSERFSGYVIKRVHASVATKFVVPNATCDGADASGVFAGASLLDVDNTPIVTAGVSVVCVGGEPRATPIIKTGMYASQPLKRPVTLGEVMGVSLSLTGQNLEVVLVTKRWYRGVGQSETAGEPVAAEVGDGRIEGVPLAHFALQEFAAVRVDGQPVMGKDCQAVTMVEDGEPVAQPRPAPGGAGFLIRRV